ncbi:putative Ubiquitin-conjugating enzyme E2 Z [Hypsibius exemplaris]|uniref:Ubiquitin-conjugating enzyme E2 Z n=1 Tax=Hypsibius exemplaris TaxID=2072580 RepID=A0A9X6RN84_HYPEX|nr:putative Ubiquitin-conjugating enzyme E2 Z [Hypsibius exemplaris]
MWRMESSNWDPSKCKEWDTMQPNAICHARIGRDIRHLLDEEREGDLDIFVYPNDENVTKLLGLIIGPAETPYAGGFFQFYLRVPPDYPISPPRVRNLTTGESTVRFGPNLYNDGKVCLSILGTFSGPHWTPILNVGAVLKSIQSLMSSSALRNEPSYENLSSKDRQVVEYDRIITHETIRVAVVDSVRQAVEPACTFPVKFRVIMLRRFLRDKSLWLKICEDNCPIDGAPMNCIYGPSPGPYKWKALKQHLLDLEPKVLTALEQLDVPKEGSEKAGEKRPEAN